jgi:hypothetical protein
MSKTMFIAGVLCLCPLMHPSPTRAAAFTAFEAAVIQSPTCFDIPAPDTCLVRVHRDGTGGLETRLVKSYVCRGSRMQVQASTVRIRLRLKRDERCDELGALVPEGSTLAATLRMLRRADEFSHLVGRFQIIAPLTNQVLYSGTMEMMERVGSHHSPFGPNGEACEACDQKLHLEGWLFGCGMGHQTGQRLRANVTANRASGALTTRLVASIDGVLLRP